MCYAKSLASTGDVIIYLCSFRLPKSLDYIVEVEQNIYIIGKPQIKNRKRILRNFTKVFYLFSTLLYFYNFNKKYKSISFTWLFFSTKLFNDIIALIYVKMIRNEPIFCEKNELKTGMILNQNRDLFSIIGVYAILLFPVLFLNALLNDRILTFYNGVIAISRGIESFSNKYNRNVIRIPVLTDLSSSYPIALEHNNSDVLLICYAGSISVKKEGLLDLLKALTIVKLKGGYFVLNLYGAGDKVSLKLLNEFIYLNGLQNDVNLHDNLPHDKILKIYSKHHLLVMTRRSNRQTEFGFSTKLAEYLSSGIATLVTDVSDNRLYIQDGLNGFLVKPGNVEEMADKLYKITKREYNLLQIGKNGRAIAEKYFDNNIYNVLLKQFFFK